LLIRFWRQSSSSGVGTFLLIQREVLFIRTGTSLLILNILQSPNISYIIITLYFETLTNSVHSNMGAAFEANDRYSEYRNEQNDEKKRYAGNHLRELALVFVSSAAICFCADMCGLSSDSTSILAYCHKIKIQSQKLKISIKMWDGVLMPYLLILVAVKRTVFRSFRETTVSF
jgi:hypothetical protein